MQVGFREGTKVTKLRGGRNKRVGVISRTYPGTGDVLVRWLDTKDDERLSLNELRIAKEGN